MRTLNRQTGPGVINQRVQGAPGPALAAHGVANAFFANRSGNPFTIQLAMCVILHVTNDIECTARNRFIVEVMESPHVGPA